MSEVMQSLWVGGKLSLQEQLSISSFIKNGHEYHLYTYDKLNVPKGTIIKDANEIILEKHIFQLKTGKHKGSYAHFADWFRWKLLYERGGYWVDTDMVCLKKFNFSDDIVCGKQHFNTIAIGVLKFPKKHPICLEMLRICENPYKFLPWDSAKGKLKKVLRKYLFGNKKYYVKFAQSGGPYNFTALMQSSGLYQESKPYTYFYPVHCGNWDAIFDKTLKGAIFFKDTYAIHLWNEANEKKGKDINKVVPQSYYSELIDKYM